MDASSPIMSWQSRKALQQPVYPDAAHLEQVLAKLRSLPPLVTSWEIERLRSLLAEAAEGRRFVLQGGDCAETLADCTPDAITGKMKILLQMSLVLVFGGRKPVIRIGRIAGQYAKPRSMTTESRDGQTLPSYFGDLVNQYDFTPEARRPNPQLMVCSYQHAAMTLNFIRALIDGGFADLHHPEYWDLTFCDNAELRQDYMELVRGISQSIEFMESIGEAPIHELTRVEFFTSHEGLNLLYESAGTRTVPRRSGYYNLTTHFPWIGDRTRDIDGAHVEYFRQIRNPIGIKVGPSARPDDLLRLCDILDPDHEPGRITIIHRFGASALQQHLPPLLSAFTAAGRTVLWLCDPMHGNTRSTSDGRKTRDYDSILQELDASFATHRANGSTLGGVHFELTGDHVTECTGGARGLTEEQLSTNYRSTCDPRLNYEQALELVFRIARCIGPASTGMH